MQEFGWQGGSVDCFAIQSGNGGTTAIVVSLMLSCLRQNASEAEDAEMALYVQRVQKSVDNLLPHSPSGGFAGMATQLYFRIGMLKIQDDPKHGSGCIDQDSQERSGHIAEKGTSAFLERARLMRCRASDAGKKLKDHAKRRLQGPQRA